VTTNIGTNGRQTWLKAIRGVNSIGIECMELLPLMWIHRQNTEQAEQSSGGKVVGAAVEAVGEQI